MNKNQALSYQKIVEVPIPDTDMVFYLKRLNGISRDKYQIEQFKVADKQKTEGLSAVLPLQPLLLSLSLCNKEGDLMFTDEKEVNALDGEVLDILGRKALEINGFTKEAQEAIAKKV